MIHCYNQSVIQQLITLKILYPIILNKRVKIILFNMFWISFVK